MTPLRETAVDQCAVGERIRTALARARVADTLAASQDRIQKEIGRLDAVIRHLPVTPEAERLSDWLHNLRDLLAAIPAPGRDDHNALKLALRERRARGDRWTTIARGYARACGVMAPPPQDLVRLALRLRKMLARESASSTKMRIPVEPDVLGK